MTIADILKENETARITLNDYWIVWNGDDECFEIYRHGSGGRVYFDAVFTDEDNAVKYFLLVTGSDADNPAPPAKSG